MSNIEMKPVESSNIAEVGYDEGTLYVRFTNNTLYTYFEVSEDLFHNLVTADSVGKYFNQHVKNEFSFERVE